MAKHIDALQNELTRAISMAIVTQRRLRDAQREAGMSAPQRFWTEAEVTAIRAEHREELRGVLMPDPSYRVMASAFALHGIQLREEAEHERRAAVLKPITDLQTGKR